MTDPHDESMAMTPAAIQGAVDDAVERFDHSHRHQDPADRLGSLLPGAEPSRETIVAALCRANAIIHHRTMPDRSDVTYAVDTEFGVFRTLAAVLSVAHDTSDQAASVPRDDLIRWAKAATIAACDAWTTITALVHTASTPSHRQPILDDPAQNWESFERLVDDTQDLGCGPRTIAKADRANEPTLARAQDQIVRHVLRNPEQFGGATSHYERRVAFAVHELHRLAQPGELAEERVDEDLVRAILHHAGAVQIAFAASVAPATHTSPRVLAAIMEADQGKVAP